MFDALKDFSWSKIQDFTFSNGEVLTLNDMRTSSSNSPEREFALLVYSAEVSGWCSMCGLKPSDVLVRFNVRTTTSKPELITETTKNVGSKFSSQEVRDFLRRSRSEEPSKVDVEHSWSLSNSCGELVDAKDPRRYAAIAFAGRGEKDSAASVNVDSKLGEYLAYCLSLYDASLRKSSASITEMYEKFVKVIRTYLLNSTLSYFQPVDNILLTGILYDMCKENNMFSSTYVNNLRDFDIFKNKYLPMIEDIFSFRWSEPAPDARLLFEVSAYELMSVIPTLNVIDSAVVLKSHLGYVENYVDDPGIAAIEPIVDALLAADNPELDKGKRWVGFHVYYGVFRTAMVRVEPRPSAYLLPLGEDSFTIVMTRVEEFFSEKQREVPNLTLRRRFCGMKAADAFEVFKTLRIGFPPITTLSVPDEYAYLNVDYYKFVKSHSLASDELVILSNIAKEVSKRCSDRKVSVVPKPIAQRKGRSFVKLVKPKNPEGLIDSLWKYNRTNTRNYGRR